MESCCVSEGPWIQVYKWISIPHRALLSLSFSLSDRSNLWFLTAINFKVLYLEMTCIVNLKEEKCDGTLFASEEHLLVFKTVSQKDILTSVSGQVKQALTGFLRLNSICKMIYHTWGCHCGKMYTIKQRTIYNCLNVQLFLFLLH